MDRINQIRSEKVSKVMIYMGFDATKPAFGVSDKVRLKPACPAIHRLARIMKFCMEQA